MIPWRFSLSLLAGLLLFGAFPLCAAPRVHHPKRKAPAHHLTHHAAHHSVHHADKHPARHYRHPRYGHARSSRHHHRTTLPAGPSSNRIEQIQGALARAGYYKSDASGRWDGDTVAAMKHFQEDQGLSPTGKIDALTLQKLGLGSDTAGLSAPHPPPPAPISTSANRAPAPSPAPSVSRGPSPNH
jgi:Putative peptidoglycan binding domain